MKENQPQFIILVDEDPHSAKQVKQMLQLENPNAVITHFSSTSRILDIIKGSDVSLLITELRFGDGYSGLNLIEDIRSQPRGKKIPILVLTEKEHDEIPHAELQEFGVKILHKPAEKEEINKTVSLQLKAATVHASPTQKINLQSGEFLFREGDSGTNLFILMEGKLKALKRKASEDKAVGEIGHGQIFGEMSMIDGSPRSVSIQAAEDSIVFELHSEDMRTYLQQQPAWVKILIESLLGRIRSLNRNLADF